MLNDQMTQAGDAAAAMASPRATPPVRRRRSPERIRKQQATRLQLLEAAGRVIGEHGYAGCTIGRVAAHAKVAHGSVYLHFASQQALFDEVLPTLGQRMLESLHDAVRDSVDVLDLERRGLEANFAYLAANSHMHRVFFEAEQFAPAAYRRYSDMLAASYARSLVRSLPEGRFRGDEMLSVANMLMGVRTQLLKRYATQHCSIVTLPGSVIGTYLKFVGQGLLGQQA